MLRRAGCFNLGEQGVVEGGGMRARESMSLPVFVCVVAIMQNTSKSCILNTTLWIFLFKRSTS